MRTAWDSGAAGGYSGGDGGLKGSVFARLDWYSHC